MTFEKIAEIFIDGNMPAALLVYVSKALGNNFTKEQILAQITPAMATKFKSFYDKLIDEGIEKGMEKAKLKTVQRMADLGLTIEQIAFSVELSVEEAKAILKK